MASLLHLLRGPYSFCRDVKQLKDGQPYAAAIRPGLIVSGRQEYEIRPAVGPGRAARTRRVGTPGGREMASRLPLLRGFNSPGRDVRQLIDNLTLAPAARPWRGVSGQQTADRWQPLAPAALPELVRDAKQLRDLQPFAGAARPGLIVPRRQEAERWPALCPCRAAQTRPV